MSSTKVRFFSSPNPIIQKNLIDQFLDFQIDIPGEFTTTLLEDEMNTKDRLFSILNSTKSPVMLVGLHGVGKSEMVAQYAESVGKPCLDIRLSQYTEGDLLGIPRFDDSTKTSMFYPPAFLYQVSLNPCILFLDELNRATREVRQAVFQLADSRKLGSISLHPDTQVVSACNPDDADYQVNPLDPAELDRWMLFHFNPTLKEWVEWANNVGVDKQIISYIKENPKHLDPPTNTKGIEAMVKHPSRRSWKRLSDCLALGAGNETLYDLAAGFLGNDVGNRFASQYANIQTLINPFASAVDGSRLNTEEMLRVVTFLSNKAIYDAHADHASLLNLTFFVKSLKNKEQLNAILQALKEHGSVKWVEAASIFQDSTLVSVMYG